MDVTEHRTAEARVYLAAAIDAWSRRVLGWSIADHIRAELVADALQMAAWRRRPTAGQTIAHSDHGAVYTSWLFGKRLRDHKRGMIPTPQPCVRAGDLQPRSTGPDAPSPSVRPAGCATGPAVHR